VFACPYRIALKLSVASGRSWPAAEIRWRIAVQAYKSF
jgi:hypothetical protein